MRVYVAGPLTTGEPEQNIRNAIDAATRLLDAGHVPFLPHLNYFWNLRTPRPESTWLAWDLHWLVSCEALLRLSGKSPGADIEVSRAKELGIQTYSSVDEFLARSHTRAPAA